MRVQASNKIFDKRVIVVLSIAVRTGKKQWNYTKKNEIDNAYNSTKFIKKLVVHV